LIEPTSRRPLPSSAATRAADTVTERVYERLKAVLAPGLRNSHYQYLDALLDESRAARAWLDLGCGHNVVPDWMDVPAIRLEPLAGVDLDLAALRLNGHVRFRALASGEALPFRSGSFDLVTANMVLEHVAAPERLFREVGRVLNPGGRFLIHTPNLRGYTTALTRLLPESLRAPLAVALHRRRSEDVYPTHYRANSAGALRQLAETCGFTVASMRYVQSSPQFVRVLPLLVPEMLLIGALSTKAFAAGRPCLLATLERRAGETRPA
jgi:SAM-dependent methyltransferase